LDNIYLDLTKWTIYITSSKISFQNSFIFTIEAASEAVLGETKAIPNGAATSPRTSSDARTVTNRKLARCVPRLAEERL
jgi:hypothetical protein